jgi:hypothetical protein
MKLTLGVQALMNAIGDLAKARGIAGAVRPTVNARGELVIALIIPPRHPGEWTDAPAQSREDKKTAREKR